MARTHPRPRRDVRPSRTWLLKAAGFRYSTGREAYVLRGVGNHFGPVYRIAKKPKRR